eukprot:1159491-Pelagomonas_calceolata.AAC.15
MTRNARVLLSFAHLASFVVHSCTCIWEFWALRGHERLSSPPPFARLTFLGLLELSGHNLLMQVLCMPFGQSSSKASGNVPLRVSGGEGKSAHWMPSCGIEVN